LATHKLTKHKGVKWREGGRKIRDATHASINETMMKKQKLNVQIDFILH